MASISNAYSVLPYATITMSHGFRVVSANKAAFDVLRCPDIASLRTRLTELIDTDLQNRLFYEVERNRGTLKGHPLQFYHEDGVLWLTLSAMALPNDAQQEWVLTLTDESSFTPHLLLKTMEFQTVREELRMGLARDVHDNLGQEITVLRLALSKFHRDFPVVQNSPSMAENFDFLLSQAEKIAQATRRVAYELRQDTVAVKGLAVAAGQLVTSVQERSGLQGCLEVSSDWVEPQHGMENHLYRSLQELLNNMTKHSQASRFKVRLYWVQHICHLEVSDNGVGMSLGQVVNLPSAHVGLRSLRERAAIFGGTVTMRSRPEVDGFQVVIALPERRLPTVKQEMEAVA